MVDELNDEYPNHSVIAELQTQLQRCTQSLAEFRAMVFDIKEQTSKSVLCTEVIKQVTEHVGLNYPDVDVCFLPSKNITTKQGCVKILADASLLPAILNLVNNAIQATKANKSGNIEILSEKSADKWQLSIRDFGRGFTSSMLSELGVKPVNSEQGLGMAVFLSHASLERLGGTLTLTNHLEGGALVTLKLPLLTEHR